MGPLGHFTLRKHQSRPRAQQLINGTQFTRKKHAVPRLKYLIWGHRGNELGSALQLHQVQAHKLPKSSLFYAFSHLRCVLRQFGLDSVRQLSGCGIFFSTS